MSFYKNELASGLIFAGNGGMLMARRASIYAIYRGDCFIDVGTLPELAQRNKIAVGTLLFKASPTYAQRTKYEGTVRVYKVRECR